MEKVGDLVRGWFGFPGWTGDDVIGVVEFFSREVRQPDEELLQRTGELGKLLGRILQDAEVRTPKRPRHLGLAAPFRCWR